MRFFLSMILFFTVVTLVVPGCSKDNADKDRIYDIKGKVVAVDTAKRKVTLDHEDIPGFMKAMEMPFDVQDAKILEGLKAGDQVHGKLKVKGSDYKITELTKH